MAKARKNYSKRPLWQWVLLYVVIGIVIYGLIYYSGILNIFGIGSNNQQETREVQYFE